MKVHRYSEHQRRLWVHQMVHKTKPIKAICNEAQISRATLYNWLNEYNALAKEENKSADEKEPANASLSWQPNDKYKMLVSVLVKTDRDKSVSRRLAKELVKRYNLTTAQACALVNLPEEEYKYRPRKPEADDKDVYAALVQALEEQKSRTLEDCIALLQQAHPHWAIKQIKRIYRQGRLYLKRTRIRRVALLPQHTVATFSPNAPLRLTREEAFWHIGLVEQETGEEERLWLLFILDYSDGTPLNVYTGVKQICEADVMHLITKAAAENGLPKKIRIPASAPFASRGLSKWSWENRVAIHHLSLAKPENVLEAGYIQDDIKKQLSVDETDTLDQLQTKAGNWVQGFAKSNSAATNYFIKETVT